MLTQLEPAAREAWVGDYGPQLIQILGAQRYILPSPRGSSHHLQLFEQLMVPVTATDVEGVVEGVVEAAADSVNPGLDA